VPSSHLLFGQENGDLPTILSTTDAVPRQTEGTGFSLHNLIQFKSSSACPSSEPGVISIAAAFAQATSHRASGACMDGAESANAFALIKAAKKIRTSLPHNMLRPPKWFPHRMIDEKRCGKTMPIAKHDFP
jgi:hypothetical protein